MKKQNDILIFKLGNDTLELKRVQELTEQIKCSIYLNGKRFCIFDKTPSKRSILLLRSTKENRLLVNWLNNEIAKRPYRFKSTGIVEEEAKSLEELTDCMLRDYKLFKTIIRLQRRYLIFQHRETGIIEKVDVVELKTSKNRDIETAIVDCMQQYMKEGFVLVNYEIPK